MKKTILEYKFIICLILISITIFSFGKTVYAVVDPGGGINSNTSSGGENSSNGYTDEEKIDFGITDIYDYMNRFHNNVDERIDESEEVINAWVETIENANILDESNPSEFDRIYNQLQDEINQRDQEEAQENLSNSISEELNSDHPIYQQPRRNTNAQNGSSASLDDMMNDADDFVNSSGGTIQYKESALQEFSNNFYNIMLSVGVAVAVIMGGILGIKYMASSVEERATTKKTLIAYAVGCVVVFGGFAIWKLVVTILQGM